VTRALILAGGGLKVAFQAGVLQVWLDEAGLEFDVADASSGGVFNLALWCDGRTGTEIADTWRRTKPLQFFELNPLPWVSISRLERFRRNVLRRTWQIDWNRVRASGKNATFNVYDFSAQELRTKRPEEMTEDLLLAAVSLPIWFPPVEVDGRAHIDAVYATDSNLEAAIRAGADELWIIWTIPLEGTWRKGPVAQYFAAIENAAVWKLKDLLRRIDASNESIDRTGSGEFPHRVSYEILAETVPLHYVLVFSATRVQRAVQLGVEAARAWCDERGIPHAPVAARRGAMAGELTRLSFSEAMRGAVGFGVADPARAWQATNGAELTLRATVEIGGVEGFLADPQHEAQLSGTVVSEALGGKLPIERGTFNLFVADDSGRLQIRYRAWFRDVAGSPLTLVGEKRVPQTPSAGIWTDTTTLFVRVLRGHVDAEGPDVEVVAAGTLRISPIGFLRQLFTFRALGPKRRGAAARLVLRYLLFFGTTLGRVYFAR
jgi:predicted acylesterase/phospholipase RssA